MENDYKLKKLKTMLSSIDAWFILQTLILIVSPIPGDHSSNKMIRYFNGRIEDHYQYR